MRTRTFRWYGTFLLALILAGTACLPQKPPPPPDPTGRCDVDLAALDLFSSVGSTAKARPFGAADSAALLGREGDFVLENDRVRVVIANTGATHGPEDDSGAIIDADVKRGTAQSAADRFSALKLLEMMDASKQTAKYNDGLLEKLQQTMSENRIGVDLSIGSGNGPALGVRIGL